jgi:hypothetical protein
MNEAGWAFEYAVLRVVPRMERGEQVNVGVLLYCQQADYLDVAVQLDEARVGAICHDLDLDDVRSALSSIAVVCAGGAAAGAVGAGSRRERFGWLTAPRSTVVQPGPVHAGLTTDPAATVHRLLTRLVL